MREFEAVKTERLNQKFVVLKQKPRNALPFAAPLAGLARAQPVVWLRPRAPQLLNAFPKRRLARPLAEKTTPHAATATRPPFLVFPLVNPKVP